VLSRLTLNTSTSYYPQLVTSQQPHDVCPNDNLDDLDEVLLLLLLLR
jgi:hypothetical protein